MSEDLEIYHQKGGTYVIPVEVINYWVGEFEELKDRIDKTNWWLEEMLKQAKNDETKAIICGTLELLLKEIKNEMD